MMLIFLLFFCTVLLSGCGGGEAPPPETAAPAAGESRAEPLPAADGLREDDIVIGEETYTIRRLILDDTYMGGTVLDTVEIYQNGDFSEPVQRFTDFRGDGMPPLDGEFRPEDLNFDGWPDFRLFNFQHRGNEYWYCWLWDPEINGFVYEKDLSDLPNGTWDQEEQVIYTRDYWGLSGSRSAVYGWEQDTLVCLRSFEISVNIYEPPYEVENRYYTRRDREMQLEQTCRGDSGDWGDSLVAPDAEAYMALTVPKESTAAPEKGEIS